MANNHLFYMSHHCSSELHEVVSSFLSVNVAGGQKKHDIRSWSLLNYLINMGIFMKGWNNQNSLWLKRPGQ